MNCRHLWKIEFPKIKLWSILSCQNKSRFNIPRWVKMFSERIYRILMNFLRAIIRFNCNLLRTWISTEMMNLYIFWNNTLNTLLNKLLKGGPINWHFLNEFWLSFHVQLLINFRNWHHFHSLSRYHRHFFTF